MPSKSHETIPLRLYTYICVDVDFGCSLAGEPDKLSRIQFPHHHFSGLLDSAEGLGRALIIPILYCLYLAENLVGDSAYLQKNTNVKMVYRKYIVFTHNPISIISKESSLAKSSLC
jgi:hypothetical protein